MTSTTFELPGHRIIQSLGVVRGVTVRSRSLLGTIGAKIETIFGLMLRAAVIAEPADREAEDRLL
jgi:uncharacterized protein YbjQ (UPF0145 family)